MMREEKDYWKRRSFEACGRVIKSRDKRGDKSRSREGGSEGNLWRITNMRLYLPNPNAAGQVFGALFDD